MKAAVGVFDITDDIEHNLSCIRRISLDAQSQGCDIICFPEMSYSGYYCDDTRVYTYPEELKNLKIEILIGYPVDGKIAMVSNRGNVFYKYHLGTKEQKRFIGHDQYCDVSQCGYGCVLCYDSHFPYLYMHYALDGAEFVFAPHYSPRADYSVLWDRYMAARAYDNRIYVLAVDYPRGMEIWDYNGETLVKDFETMDGFVCVDMESRFDHRGTNKDFLSRARKDLF